ncbi:MAG: entericidin A/B family lipoprotein [Pseudomonadota bacterium]
MRWLHVILLGALALSACNTVQGVGQDVQGAGQAIEEGAEKTKNAIFN